MAAKSHGTRIGLHASMKNRFGARTRTCLTPLLRPRSPWHLSVTTRLHLPWKQVFQLSGNSASLRQNRDTSIWTQFEGFIPNHSATFVNEFWRLSRHMRWDKKERGLYRAQLFEADFENHYGKDIRDLAAWQDFCRICSVQEIPETIPGCIEALDAILVNIYDVLDHRRSGQPIIPFAEFEEFAAYTRKGRKYPLDEAKADTFLPVFLKKLT
ncbi:hypothetical protein ACEQ8H_006336 [Pleosporales sp. CAS-2024a]